MANPRQTSPHSERFPLFIFLIAAALCGGAFAQDLPGKIRGYKVHKQDVTVVRSGSLSQVRTDASVEMGEPELVDAGLFDGLVFELNAEILSATQSGKIDFLTFHDVRVNDIAVNVEEYRHPFSFAKAESFSLPRPARVMVPPTSLLLAAWRETAGRREEWKVTGRAFLFGKFRRFGLYHKRVVPVDFSFTLQNPLLK